MIIFKNCTGNELYDEFITLWSIQINKSCTTDCDFCIHFITLEQLHNEYNYLEEYSQENYDDSPYGCIYDAGFDNRVNNVIIVNVELVESLDLSKDECIACILHEIGHLHYHIEYAETSGDRNVSLKELMADCFAKNLGRGNDLKSALTKLSHSGLSTKEYCEGAIDWRIERL